MATVIHVNSNLLRQPCLFDELSKVVGRKDAPELGGRIGRLARDLILYAAWNKSQSVLLHVPEFCHMFGHDNSMLLHRCTPEQQDEMRACGLPEDYIPAYSNFLGYTLVKMGNNNFMWPKRGGLSARNKTLVSHQLVTETDAPHVRRKRGTFVRFSVSSDIVTQEVNRLHYQDITLEDYVALRTKTGNAWDAARTLYMRVAWKRGWWDSPKVTNEVYPSLDNYDELVTVANLSTKKPLRNQASQLLAMLRVVGALPSVCMVPQMHLRKGRYSVTWTRYALGTVGGPPKNLEYECPPAPESWGSDPNPPSTFYQGSAEAAPVTYTWKPGGAGVEEASAPAVLTAVGPAGVLQGAERHEAEQELTSKLNSLRWLNSTEAAEYYKQRPAGELDRHQREAAETVQELRQALGLNQE